MADRWYRAANDAEIESPALLVYPRRIKENIHRMIGLAAGTQRLRPHIKTHKMVEVVELQRAAGITKFKSSTIAETEMLADCGVADVMLAYPLVGPNIRRFATLAVKYRDLGFSTLADDAATIRLLSQALTRAKVRAGVLIDLDVGLHRSGIAPGESAVALYRLIDELPGVVPAGLHIYDGHLKDRDVAIRAARLKEDYAGVWRLRDRLTELGFEVPEVVAGGTPTFGLHAANPEVTCSPGTCTLWDHNYGSRFPDLDFLHAATVMTRVISKPGETRLCLDLGYKAVSPDNPDPRVVLLDLPDARTVIHNEEHLTVETPHADDYPVGAILYGVPFHICPTTALYREAVVVEGGRAVGTWTVAARDRKLSI